MEPRAQNLVIIMSDEHSPKALGCYGHPIVRTPHLDALARRGTRFTAAYCNNPVCVPSRASFALGKYTHQIGYWDNADPYAGAEKSWHHTLRDRGHEVVSIGKLHFRATGEDHGFSEEIIPMHVVEGKGDLLGLVREDLPERGGSYKMARFAGPGESQYTYYDREIAARAQVWLHEAARRKTEKPWVLFVSFVCPHFPLTAPPEHYYRYYNQDLPTPKLYAKAERPMHPSLVDYRGSFNYDDHFTPEIMRKAIAGYYGLCSFLDENVGKVLGAIAASGLEGSTRVIYTSDHGDNLGARGCWGKSTMYEEAAGVPMIITGADIPAGRVVDAPVSLVDGYPSILDGVGIREAGQRQGYPGHSLFDIAHGARPDRNVLVEYHGMGSTTGAYMIRHGRWKYIHYVGYPDQLFDLDADPEELVDRAGDQSLASVLAECRRRLRAICDPAEVNARAKARQAALLAANGGRAAVIARGDLGFTPAPGAVVAFD